MASASTATARRWRRRRGDGTVASARCSADSTSRGSASVSGAEVCRRVARRSRTLSLTVGMRPVWVALAAAPTNRWGRAARSRRSAAAEDSASAVPCVPASPVISSEVRANSGSGTAPRASPACGTGAVSSVSKTWTTTTVTLSGAPRSRVSSTSVSTIWLRSSVEPSTEWMVSGRTTALSPSEHSSQRSPRSGRRVSTSISGEASTSPSTRMRTFLCGWDSASSGRSRPSSMSRWTKVWSLVTWRNSSPRSRYARESPMWATTSSSWSASRAVTVVPMPPRRALPRTSLARFWLAFWISSVSTVAPSPWWSGRSRLVRSMTAEAEATSPPTCPPMPSATTAR